MRKNKLIKSLLFMTCVSGLMSSCSNDNHPDNHISVNYSKSYVHRASEIKYETKRIYLKDFNHYNIGKNNLREGTNGFYNLYGYKNERYIPEIVSIDPSTLIKHLGITNYSDVYSLNIPFLKNKQYMFFIGSVEFNDNYDSYMTRWESNSFIWSANFDSVNSTNYNKLAVGNTLYDVDSYDGLSFDGNNYTITSSILSASRYLNFLFYSPQVYNNTINDIYFDVTYSVVENRLDDKQHTLNLKAGDDISIDEISSLFRAEDIFGEPVDLELLSDGGFDCSTANIYIVKYQAEDTYGNTATLTVNVIVKDYHPTITLKNTSSNLFKVNYSQNVLTDYFYDFIDISDYDGSSLSYDDIVWDKPFDGKKFGTTEYTLSIKSKLMSDQSSSLTIKIDVTQDLPPVFFLTSSIAITSSETPLSVDDLKNLIASVNNVSVSSMSNFKIDNYNDYFSAYDKQIDLTYTFNSSGETKSGILSLLPKSESVTTLSISEKLNEMWVFFNSNYFGFSKFTGFFTYVIPNFFKIIFGGSN